VFEALPGAGAVFREIMLSFHYEKENILQRVRDLVDLVSVFPDHARVIRLQFVVTNRLLRPGSASGASRLVT
jgi:hypothetical protein